MEDRLESVLSRHEDVGDDQVGRLRPVQPDSRFPVCRIHDRVARALQDPDVLGDGVERDVERRGDFGDARIAAREALEDAAAGFVRQRDQGVVEVHARNINPKG